MTTEHSTRTIELADPNATIARDAVHFTTSRSVASGITVRCPTCQSALEVLVDADLSRLKCGSCGGTFDLSGDSNGAARVAVAKIAHFELLERVGVGGFGAVWKARDVQLDRIVALKIPRQGQLAPEVLDDFLHEARTAAQLAHPFIVRIHEIGRDGEMAYIVSELIHGQSLDKWVEEHSPDHHQVAELCVKVLQALDHAHHTGVIHRDLKPHNILMDADGSPHITDFGLAKRSGTESALNQSGRILGTPAYMPPEQAAGRAHAADARTDIYSFGVVLFELLTGSLPFRGTARVLIEKAQTEEPPRPRSLDASIHEDLETICLKCLEKTPAKRYASAAEVADELQRFLNCEPIRARKISNAARFFRWCRRHPVFPSMFVSVVAVLLIVTGFGWIWFERAYRQADRALTDQALRGVGFASESVANAATRELEGWYELLEIMARDERLLNGLESLESESTPGGWLSEMNDAELPEESRDELRRRLLVHPGQRQLQEVLSEYRAKAPKVFGWFVLERNGLQVAREPENKTIGMNYAWRTYYHGEEIDYADQRSYEGSARRRIRATHLSAAFVSQITDRWVVVISTPVYRYSDSQPQAILDDDNFLGVVALMFELGEITQIPDSDAERVFSALVDTRVGRRGAILQHPLYESLLRARDRRLPDRFQDLRVDLDGWKPISHGSQLSLKSNYRDPLGKDPEGAMFDRRWLAAKAPVQVRGVDTGLWAIVQQSYDQTIGNELARLHEKILLVAFASLALIVCLVIPTWAIVLRVTR